MEEKELIENIKKIDLDINKKISEKSKKEELTIIYKLYKYVFNNINELKNDKIGLNIEISLDIGIFVHDIPNKSYNINTDRLLQINKFLLNVKEFEELKDTKTKLILKFDNPNNFYIVPCIEVNNF